MGIVKEGSTDRELTPERSENNKRKRRILDSDDDEDPVVPLPKSQKVVNGSESDEEEFEGRGEDTPEPPISPQLEEEGELNGDAQENKDDEMQEVEAEFSDED